MEKKKVALMSYAMDNRKAKGTALYTRKLIEGLLQTNKFDYTLVHYDKVDDPLYKQAHEILMPRVRLPFGSRFISQMLFFWKYRNEQFDIIHWFQPRIYPFYWFAPAKKIIVTMHGAADVSAPTNFVFSREVFNFVLQRLNRWIDCMIVVSNNAKEEVAQYYGFPEEKIAVTYNGGGEDYHPMLPVEASKLLAEKYNITHPYIFDLSRLIPHKNVASLIRAYTLMREKYSERKEKLVIVGGSGYKSEKERVAREESSFREDILFVEFVPPEHLNAFYSAASVFVFPSLSEGFGLPVVEAMASGVPVITSNTTSLPEVGGDAVELVSPLDISEIVEKMHKVLSNKNLQIQMISRGLHRAKEFTWGKMVEKTIGIYRTLVKEK